PYTEVDIIDVFDRLSADIVTTCLYSFKLNPWADTSANQFVVNATHTFTPSRLRLLLYTLLPKYMLTALGVKHPVRDSANEYFISMTRHIIAERKRNTSNNYNDFIDLAINAENNNIESDSQDTGDHNISATNGSNGVKKGIKRGDSYMSEDEALANSSNGVKKGIKRGDSYMSEDEALANSWVFINSGCKVIATTLVFIAYELALHPNHQQRLYEEVKGCVGTGDKEIDFESISQMPFLEAVINESQRLHTISIRMRRMAVTDYELGDTGITIRKGDTVDIPIYAIHHYEQYYRNPNVFDPYRFMPHNRDKLYYRNPNVFDPYRFMPHNRDKLVPNTYIPFSLGNRQCIAMRFVLLELRLTLINLILEYRFVTTVHTDRPLRLLPSSFQHSPQRLLLGLEKRVEANIERTANASDINYKEI
ncbi:unnamed protein product, partial [Oppiella nova]